MITIEQATRLDAAVREAHDGSYKHALAQAATGTLLDTVPFIGTDDEDADDVAAVEDALQLIADAHGQAFIDQHIA